MGSFSTVDCFERGVWTDQRLVVVQLAIRPRSRTSGPFCRAATTAGGRWRTRLSPGPDSHDWPPEVQRFQRLASHFSALVGKVFLPRALPTVAIPCPTRALRPPSLTASLPRHPATTPFSRRHRPVVAARQKRTGVLGVRAGTSVAPPKTSLGCLRKVVQMDRKRFCSVFIMAIASFVGRRK